MFDHSNNEIAEPNTPHADVSSKLLASAYDWEHKHQLLAGAAIGVLATGAVIGLAVVGRRLLPSEAGLLTKFGGESADRITLSAARQEELVREAQAEASHAIAEGNPPFGALLIDRAGNILARAHNTQVSAFDATGHAEINLLRQASQQMRTKSFEGLGLGIVGNAEPCSMCASASIKAGIRNFYFGASHEASMDPVLDITTVARASKKPVFVTGSVLEKSSAAQIAEARAGARFSLPLSTRFTKPS